MKTILKKTVLATLALFIILSFTNCEATKNLNNKQKGGAIGATGGAILGAILGNNIGKGGNGEIGAVIGGVVGGVAGVIIGSKMDKQAQEIENEIPGAQVERIDDGIVITFNDESSGVYFNTGKYNINAISQSTLDKLTGILKEYLDTNILVIGHTDSVGSEVSNLTLSKNRANAVTHYFTHKGLNGSRFTTNWFGETQPTHTNNTTEGRSKNRRVNVIIVPNDKMKQDAQKEAGN